jgi:multidrug efflux system membrane fusion protein
MSRSWILAILILVAASAWVLTGQLGGGEAASAPGGDAAPRPAAAGPAADRPLPQVRIAEISAEPMTNEIVLQGRTQADRRAEIRAEVAGRVEEVAAERGARLAAGGPIVRLAEDDRRVELDRARALLAQREIEHNAARRLQQRGFESEIRLAEATAELNAARSQVERAELALRKTVVRAPFDGVMEDRGVVVGDYVSPGGLIASVIDLDPIRVVGFVSERNVLQLAVGQPGRARVLGEMEVEGRIGFVASSADPATRTFRVELHVPNPQGRIVDGLTAQLRLPGDPVEAHRIPPSVLTLADDGTVGVKLVDEGETVRFAPVRILADTPEGQVWVGGLPARARLIMVGQEFVAAGQRVRPSLVAARDADGAGAAR